MSREQERSMRGVDVGSVRPEAGLDGPSRTIIVEPQEMPVEAPPDTAPTEPVREPDREPVPA